MVIHKSLYSSFVEEQLITVDKIDPSMMKGPLQESMTHSSNNKSKCGHPFPWECISLAYRLRTASNIHCYTERGLHTAIWLSSCSLIPHRESPYCLSLNTASVSPWKSNLSCSSHQQLSNHSWSMEVNEY